MPKILITGGSGLLGSKITKAAESEYTIMSTDSGPSILPNSIEMDITNKDEVSRTLDKFKPDVVIHAAAETNVDRCETEKEHAWKVNVEGAKNVAEACNKIGARLIYVSTDYVFDGEKGLYTEDDTPNPVSYYGLTKLEGEKRATKICENHVIARTSVLYGWHPSKQNFVTWVIKSLEQKKQIYVADDHYNSPTLANNLADVLLELAESDTIGVIHTAGDTRINRFYFTIEIAKTFDLNPTLIKPIKMSELKAWVAKRPRDSSLCIDKAKKELKTKLLTVQESLKFLKTHRD